MSDLDCQRCGACCCNTDENRAEGYVWYVQFHDGDDGSRLLTASSADHGAGTDRKVVVWGLPEGGK